MGMGSTWKQNGPTNLILGYKMSQNEYEKYKNLHTTNIGYQNNNWLMDEIPYIRSLKLDSLLEVGCGNGRFLKEICNHVPKSIGIDLVKSPILDDTKYIFYQKNIYTDDLPFKTDLVLSADVLEHFIEDKMVEIIQKLLTVSNKQYHIIACYDDGHSHQTIKSPEEWLKLFNLVSSDFKLKWVKKRKERDICLIFNF